MPEDEVPLGYTFNFPIREPGDTKLLHPRAFAVNRARTLARSQVPRGRLRRPAARPGRQLRPVPDRAARESWAGNYFIGLTWQVYRFIGNDGLLYWVYDAPETIHWLMEYMTQDRERMFALSSARGSIAPNTDNQMAGPRAYGYVSSLPGPDSAGPDPTQGRVVLGRFAGDHQHLARDVQGVRPPVHRTAHRPASASSTTAAASPCTIVSN